MELHAKSEFQELVHYISVFTPIVFLSLVSQERKLKKKISYGFERMHSALIPEFRIGLIC